MSKVRDECPGRFINGGVAEQSMIGICGGLALRGCQPFAYTIATFTIYRPFEQVRDDLCYQNLPVTVVGIGGGIIYSTLGGTHHAQEDIAVMGALPNMSILAPCDPLETEASTRICGQRTGPTYLRLGKAGEPNLTANAPEPFVYGKLRLLKPGKDACVISYGPIMKMAFDVAAKVEQTLKPLDVDGIGRLLARYETVVVLEEHSERGGLAAQVKQIAWDTRASCRLHTFSLKDEFIHLFGSHTELLAAHGVSVQQACRVAFGVE